MAESLTSSEITGVERILAEASHYLDVPLKVSILLGNREMKIREILRLRLNSIIELPKSAGENIDIYINGRLIAFGEVIDMEGNARIRLTDLFTPV
ncbi:MAG TPA: FliM/FliN family flagellar motor switch protein [Acidobacteriota bacterium]|nr:FliM/FliN family flagellar motor switch protein [Acidobacteriota bacterium]